MSECVLCVYISGIVLHASTNLSPRSSVAASSRRRHCCCYCWCCVCSILIFYVCKRAKNRKLYNKTCQLVSQSGRQASRQPRVCIGKTWIIYLLIKFAATEWVSEWERERKQEEKQRQHTERLGVQQTKREKHKLCKWFVCKIVVLQPN